MFQILISSQKCFESLNGSLHKQESRLLGSLNDISWTIQLFMHWHWSTWLNIWNLEVLQWNEYPVGHCLSFPSNLINNGCQETERRVHWIWLLSMGIHKYFLLALRLRCGFDYSIFGKKSKIKQSWKVRYDIACVLEIIWSIVCHARSAVVWYQQNPRVAMIFLD